MREVDILKRQLTRNATKMRRAAMTCKVIECKLDKARLSPSVAKRLHSLFIEGKWLYNAMISALSTDSLVDFSTTVKQVQVKILDKFEERPLAQISSQMKQGVKTRIFSSLETLQSLKEKGYKVGTLKFKSEVNCIPLKQHNNTFTILKKQNRIRIQGFENPFRVHGLHQLPDECEIGNANLVKVGNDYFVKITVFTKKEERNVPNKSIGIDFGCTTQLTLSNGEKISYQVPINRRVKKLDKALARKVKRSKNQCKVFAKRQAAYQQIANKRKEIKNQIVSKLVKSYSTVCFQDESLAGWQASGHGKKIQFSAIGGIISALQRKAVTPVVVKKHYPSTQLCSKCGARRKMPQWERTYVCPKCGNEMDRDVNSAINIEREGLQSLVKVPAERREVKLVETSVTDLAKGTCSLAKLNAVGEARNLSL